MTEPKKLTALPRKQHGVVLRAIARWRQTEVIDEAMALRLTGSITVSSFDWQRVARYAFIISLICLVIAIGATLADEALMEIIRRIFDIPDFSKCLIFVAVSAGIFRFGVFLRQARPQKIYRNEGVFFLGLLALSVAVYFLGLTFGVASGTYPFLLFLVLVLPLLAAILYALLGLWLASPLVWVFALVSFGSWIGTQTGYDSGIYFLGMNFPLRLAILGAVFTAVGLVGQSPYFGASRAGSSSLKERLFFLSPQTKVMGLLYLFISLWILSIFGNYGEMDEVDQFRSMQILPWGLLFGAAALAAIWYGLKRDDGVLRGFGLTFLLINLYTRFFEYFWAPLPKALFFAVLAISFWYLGSRAETIWQLGRRRKETKNG